MEKVSEEAKRQDLSDASTGAADRLFTIGDMARTYKLTLRALRFYEDRGLLQPIRHGLARYYDAAARARVETILRGKQLGFTLQQIARMMARDEAAPERPRLDLQESQILTQISQLERRRGELEVAIRELRDVHSKMTGGAEANAA